MWCSVSRGAAQDARTIANAATTECRAMMSILPTVKSEEFFRSCGGCASDFFQRNSASSGDFLCDETRVSRFATFSAKWDRRQIGAIGFDHELIEWNLRGHFADLFTVFERDDSGERNKVAEPQNFVRLLAQWRDHILFRFQRVSRMNSNHRKDVGIFFGKIDRPPAALDRSADGDDACDAGLSCASKNVVEIRCEIRIIKMRVGFYEHCRLKISKFKLKNIRCVKSAIFNLKSAIPYHSTIVLAQVNPPPNTTMST